MEPDPQTTPEQQQLSHLQTLAKHAQDPYGHQVSRRECLERSLPFIGSHSLSARKEATAFATKFFDEFIDLQEQIINAAYDLAEDQDFEVRQLGYSFISALTEKVPSWTSRNVDVLVQLLATDDYQDLAAIKSSLGKLMKVDAASTLSILCDYVGSPGATDDLKGSVLAFLAEDSTKNAHLEDITGPASIAYQNGLLNAITRATPDEAQLIIDDLLLPRPLPASYPSLLIRTLLTNAVSYLSAQLDSNDDPLILTSMDGYLALAHAVEEKQQPREPLPFLDFYSSATLMDNALPRMTPENRRQYVEKLAVAFRTSMKHSRDLNTELFAIYRNRVADLSPRWAQVILSSENPWSTAVPLTRAVLQRCQEEPQWSPPQAPLRALLLKATNRAASGAVIPALREIQAIIKNIFEFTGQASLSPPVLSPASSSTPLSPLSRTTSPVPNANKPNKRKLDDIPSGLPSSKNPEPLNIYEQTASPASSNTPQTPVSSTQSLLQRLNIGLSASSVAPVHPETASPGVLPEKLTAVPPPVTETSRVRATKRLKTAEHTPTTSSLLSRIGSLKPAEASSVVKPVLNSPTSSNLSMRSPSGPTPLNTFPAPAPIETTSSSAGEHQRPISDLPSIPKRNNGLPKSLPQPPRPSLAADRPERHPSASIFEKALSAVHGYASTDSSSQRRPVQPPLREPRRARQQSSLISRLESNAAPETDVIMKDGLGRNRRTQRER